MSDAFGVFRLTVCHARCSSDECGIGLRPVAHGVGGGQEEQ